MIFPPLMRLDCPQLFILTSPTQGGSTEDDWGVTEERPGEKGGGGGSDSF